MSPALAPPAAPSGRAWPLAALLFVLTLALTWRTGSFAFLNYDDDTYVTANPAVCAGLSPAGVRWAFTTGHAANWHPLTWLAHQLDVELFGLDARGHHRTNALLHALNAALCFLALLALSGRRTTSALAAALFAVHPLRVESVAWVAERKDLLAGSFAFAALAAYAAFARRGGRARYATCLALFVLGLLSKPMLVTLPFLFLVLDAWPLGRLLEAPDGARGRLRWSVLAEKLPFLVLAAASALVTLLVQRAGGALGPLADVPLGPRLVNALRSLGLYLAKSFVPTGLCAFHPHPFLAPAGTGAWTAAPTLGLLATGAWLALGLGLRRRAPFLLVGAAWFLGLLVPVLGLVQVGLQGWAERYTYLPSVGLALALAWSVEALARLPRARRAVAAGAGLALVGLAGATSVQLRAWRDSRTLFEQAVRVEDSVVARTNLGRALEAAQDPAGAERHFARAVELAPTLAGPRVNRARVLGALGRTSEAEAELVAALATEPDLAPAHASLGWLRVEAGREAEGLPHLRRAHELDPAQAACANDLAWVLATSPTVGDAAEALRLAEGLVARSRGTQAAHLETLAAALARLGRFDEAIQWQTRALERVRGAPRARLEERLALYRAGRPCLEVR